MEAKYRLVTTWPEDSVQVRDRTSNEILVEMKPHELVTMKNTFDQAREALKLARRRLNEGMQGKIDAVMEHGGDPGIVAMLDKALAAMNGEK